MSGATIKKVTNDSRSSSLSYTVHRDKKSLIPYISKRGEEEDGGRREETSGIGSLCWFLV